MSAAGWAANEIEQWDVGRLVPYVRNARTHSEEQVAQIAGSIREFGFTNPILVAADGTLIAGHGRLAAARKLGMGQVPVIVIDHLDDAQRRALVLADNKLAMNADWNLELLSSELHGLNAEGFDLSLLGFGDVELSDLLGPLGGDEPGEGGDGGGANGSLADRFGVPPFSVLNAREGWWQDRKRAWLKLGIQSELGRGENVAGAPNATPGGAPMPMDRAKNKARIMGGQESLQALKDQGPFPLSSASANGGNATRAAADERGKMNLGRKNAAPGGGGGGGYRRGGKPVDPAYEQRSAGAPIKTVGTTEWMREKGISGGCSDGDPAVASGTSIFDPVLCELAYRWFCPPGGTILDPFAGGSVRGIVASKLGRQYVGGELRAEQVAANRAQADAICADPIPVWHVGDSRIIDKTAAGVEADFVFSCPPYADLEVYSDDPRDLSTLAYPKFREAYFEIIKAACALLKPDRFACFVVGEVRDKKGNYIGFVPDTIRAFEAAGLRFYNEAILVTSVGSLPIRVAKQFEASRKLGKTHQNVLVFVKGEGPKATKAIGPVEFGEITEDEAEGDA